MLRCQHISGRAEDENIQIVGIALLVLGIVLLVFGYNASQSLGEQLSETFTGRFSDETMMYVIGGAISAVVGLVMLLKK